MCNGGPLHQYCMPFCYLCQYSKVVAWLLTQGVGLINRAYWINITIGFPFYTRSSFILVNCVFLESELNLGLKFKLHRVGNNTFCVWTCFCNRNISLDRHDL